MYEFLKDFQTLIVGIPALIAAICAAWQVGGQLKQMQLQTNVSRRDLMAERVGELENRRAATMKPLRSVIENIGREIIQGEEVNPNIDSNFAFIWNMAISSELNRLYSRESDPQPLVDAIATTKQSLGQLNECLDALHRPYSMLGDPDLSDDDEKQLDVEEEKMRPQLGPRYIAFSASAKTLDVALGDYVSSVRNKLEKIDLELLR